MDSKQGFGLRRFTAALDRDHKELFRQIWILRMLILRGDWYNNETIERRTIELVSFLDEHFRMEVSEIHEILTYTHSAPFSMKDERLTDLVACINNPLSPNYGSYVAFQELERSLRQHAKDVDMFLLSLPSVVIEENMNEQKNTMEKEGQLLVIS